MGSEEGGRGEREKAKGKKWLSRPGVLVAFVTVWGRGRLAHHLNA